MLQVEQLEARDCPSSLQNGILTVTGTAKNDQITITQQPTTITVNQNGVVGLFDSAQVSSIVIDGKGGRNILTNQTSLPAVILAGKGNDSIQSFGSNSKIFGGGGSDLIYSILGTNDYVNTGKGLGKSVVAVNTSTTVEARDKDQVVPFFQVPVGSGSIFLDNLGNLQISPTNGGSSTAISKVNNQILVSYTDTNGTQNLLFDAATVKQIAYFGGSGNDTYVNNTRINEVAYGFSGNDTMVGGFSNRSLLKGSGGNDTIIGRGRHDDLSGNGGTDTLISQSNRPKIVRIDALDFVFSKYNDIIIPLF